MNSKHLECIKCIMKNEDVEEYSINNDTNAFNGDNYMGTMARINVTGKNKNGEAVVKNLILKIAPKSERVRSVVLIRQFYCREIFAYEKIFPAFEELQNKLGVSETEKFPFIDFYSASLDEPNEFLFIKDVGPDGFEMYPRGKAFDLEHVKIVLEYLARFHALSFALQEHKPESFKEIVDDFKRHDGFSEKMSIFIQNTMKNALKYIHNEEYREKFAKVATYEECVKSSCPVLTHPFNVICHGDFWQNNIIFKYKNGIPVDLRFVDWQLNKYSSPVIDISHFIFSVTEQSLRKDHYEEMLSLYYSMLCKSLISLKCDPNKCYPESVFQKQLNEVLVYGLIWGVSALTFSLREDEDLLDLEASVNTVLENNEYDFSFKSKISATKFTNRVEDVIEHFISLGILK